MSPERRPMPSRLTSRLLVVSLAVVVLQGCSSGDDHKTAVTSTAPHTVQPAPEPTLPSATLTLAADLTTLLPTTLANHPGLDALASGPPSDGPLSAAEVAQLNVAGLAGDAAEAARLTDAGLKRAATVTLVENPAFAQLTLIEMGSPAQAQAYATAEGQAFQSYVPTSRGRSAKVATDHQGQIVLSTEAQSGYWNLNVVYAVGQVVVREWFIDSDHRGATTLRHDADNTLLRALGVPTS